MDDFLDRAFRASPGFDLVPFDRLSAAERAALDPWLAGWDEEPQAYGLLRPSGPGLGVKTVDRDTALLLYTLREPGPLPSYLRRALGATLRGFAARLVADGVLEIERGGAFVSGPAALPLLEGGVAEVAGGQGRPAALSLAALRYGAALAAVLADPLALSERLYGYGRLPVSPAWRRRLAAGAAAFLGLDRPGAARAALDAAWVPTPAGHGWQAWQARTLPAAPLVAGAGAAGRPPVKLYVSPLPAALPELIPDLLAGLAAGGALSFKVGEGAAGLLRPDKLVAYFADGESLGRAADRLAGRLAGAPPHGVPFTAAVTADGLLSWGMDPPAAAQAPAFRGAESWRFWLTNRLARALGQACVGGSTDPARFALGRLRLEGVDTATWTPGPALFAGAVPWP
jgi:hypothetical protein